MHLKILAIVGVINGQISARRIGDNFGSVHGVTFTIHRMIAIGGRSRNVFNDCLQIAHCCVLPIRTFLGAVGATASQRKTDTNQDYDEKPWTAGEVGAG